MGYKVEIKKAEMGHYIKIDNEKIENCTFLKLEMKPGEPYKITLELLVDEVDVDGELEEMIVNNKPIEREGIQSRLEILDL